MGSLAREEQPKFNVGAIQAKLRLRVAMAFIVRLTKELWLGHCLLMSWKEVWRLNRTTIKGGSSKILISNIFVYVK
jgi:hypothetical protein